MTTPIRSGTLMAQALLASMREEAARTREVDDDTPRVPNGDRKEEAIDSSAWVDLLGQK